MNYYPVFITTLNRYTHFRRCVESLARNTHADKTELVIGLDYPPSKKYEEGYLKIKDYIPYIKGFKKVTVFERSENFGPSRNFSSLKEYVFSHYDAAICSEDDNEFSPCFLDYMNKTLDFFGADSRVTSISGYISRSYYGLMCNVIFSYDNNAWGCGLWRSKENTYAQYSEVDFVKIICSIRMSYKIFRTSPGVFSMLIEMVKKKQSWYDVKRTVLNIVNGTYQLRPSFSLSRNTGYDGSGIHCGTSDMDDLAHQTISEDSFFDFDSSDVADVNNPVVKKQMFLHCLPSGYMAQKKFLLFLILRYIKLRFRLF
jgi:hypothetical protein